MRLIEWVDRLWARMFVKRKWPPKQPSTLTIFRADGNVLAVAHRWDMYRSPGKVDEYVAWFQTLLQADELPRMSTAGHIFDGEKLRAVIFISDDWHPVFDFRDGRWLADVEMIMREVSK